MIGWLFFQREIVQELVKFLKTKLPQVGGEDWWNSYVLAQLSPYQVHRVGTQQNLGDLDLAALLQVALASCDEFVANGHASDQYIDALQKIKRTRNRHAHAPADGYKPAIEAKDLEDSAELIDIIGSNADLSLRLTQAAAEFRSSSRKNKKTSSSNSSDGISEVPDGSYLGLKSPSPKSPEKMLSNTTYLGMDFGTSTTVVSAVVHKDSRVQMQPLVLEQPDQYGVPTRSHLVNSVIAHLNGRLVFGREAYRQRSLLHEGRSVFSSFKMKLGIDLGPSYPETAVRSGVMKSGIKIESAQDAAKAFFQFIRQAVGSAVASERMPDKTQWCVSVPASFEANQRRDLENALREGGISAEDVALIDEPNAAFLSYLFEAAQSQTDNRLLDTLRTRPVNVMVYDFGAGTCDVSILQLEIGAGGIESRNRAVSRFTALGGDDFDRALARDVLLPQLCEASSDATPSQRDIEERLIPRLQPSAELLKIRLLEHVQNKGIATVSAMRRASDLRVTSSDIEPFSIGPNRYELPSPGASLSNLADALEPYVKLPAPLDDRIPHVFAPVRDALEKSGLIAEDLDAVLFIGGSSENPIVREAVMKGLGCDVEAIIPSDLRSHVSKGAALHSYWFNGCGFDFIQPITSEPILAIAKGGQATIIIPASTPLPTSKEFNDDLIVQVGGQSKVEIPICVSSAEKLVGVLTIEAPDDAGFEVGSKVRLSVGITREKILEIEAQIGSQVAKTAILNPLANHPLTEAETSLLKAKQEFNRVLYENRGRPPVGAVITFASAAAAAGDHRQAAEMYQKAEQIDPKRNFAVNITYNYAMAGMHHLSEIWARKAYQREPSAVSAYNLAIDVSDEDEKIRLLRESLRISPEYYSAMAMLGRILIKKGVPEGTALLEKCSESLSKQLRNHKIHSGDCRTLARVARDLGQTDLAQKAEARAKTHTGEQGCSSPYSEKNLLGLTSPGLLSK